MFNYIWPIALLVISNTFYNIASKSTPSNANSFMAMMITYTVAAVICFAGFLITKPKGSSIRQEFLNVNCAAYIMGLCIIGLELGYIFAFRSGWKISLASLVANILLAVVLFFVGIFVYKEKLSIKKITGILICIAGLIIVNLPDKR